MTDYTYIIKGCVITVKFGSTTVTCAVGQGGTLDVDFDVGELFGQESVERQEKWVERYHPRISISHAKFDGALIKELLGTAGTADQDFDGNTKTGYTVYSVTGATYDHPTFEVRGEFKDRADTKVYAFAVSGVIFSNLSLPFPGEGSIIRNLTGTGDLIEIMTPTPT